MSNRFTQRLELCDCCPRRCLVNRLAGEKGVCQSGAGAEIAYAGLHHGEEPPISGTRGSGTVFFSRCNLHCVFCQNHQISQPAGKGDYRTLSAAGLAEEMLWLQQKGAHNINFVSPSHMVWQMAEAILTARDLGLTVPVIYNSNGYDSIDTLRQIQGLVEIYLPDLKYLDSEVAKKYSHAEDYPEVVPGVLKEMLRQVGHLKVDKNGIACKGILVRHLVLPGQLTNSKKCLRLLAELSPDISLSIMSQYSPQYNACQYPELDRALTAAEYDKIVAFALDLGLEKAFIQELESQEHYLPDFNRYDPFNRV